MKNETEILIDEFRSHYAIIVNLLFHITFLNLIVYEIVEIRSINTYIYAEQN